MRSSSDGVARLAWRDGWRRVLAAPWLLAGCVVATFATALPLAIVLHDQIEGHLGRSLMADAAADGANWDWWQEFGSQASGIGTTLTPSVIGAAATLDNLSSLLDARPEVLPITAAIVVYLGGWLVLSAGVIARYAGGAAGSEPFLAACGRHAGALLRLACLAALVYWLLFGVVHDWLFDSLYRRLTRDLDVERTAFAWRLSFYAVFGCALAGVTLVTDYTRARLVVERRRSVAWALRAALAFIARHPRDVAGVFLLNAGTFVLLLAGWAAAAPGAGNAGGRLWLGVAATQLFLTARLAVKLQFMAAGVALLQRHVGGPPRP